MATEAQIRAQVKQPPYDELIESLRRDWDIEASWDGLRRFWYVGLTDEGVRKRDDLQRTNAENAKLRELARDMWEGYNDPRCEECHLKDTPTCADCPICAREASVIDRMRELGIEVDG